MANPTCIVSLKSNYERLKTEHDDFLKSVQEYSEEAKQAFLANPKSVWFQWTTETREKALTNQWNDQVLRANESLARKAKRMDLAHTAYARECWFQAEHAYVNTVIDDKILFGYYKVFRILSSDDGRPKHYEFVLKRSTHALGDTIPAKVIVPLSTVMGTAPGVPTASPFFDVSPSKITLKEEEHHDDHLCDHCHCDLGDCTNGGDHGDAFRTAHMGY